jgi:hypothetical protein
MRRKANWSEFGIQTSKSIFVLFDEGFDFILVGFCNFTALQGSYQAILGVYDEAFIVASEIALYFGDVIFDPRKCNSVLFD